MKIRFQADENLDRAIVSGLLRREPSVDFHTAEEAGLLGADDSTVLEKCAAEGRMLVTHDLRTIPEHFAEFITQRPSPSVLLIPQKLSIGIAIEGLLLIWHSYDAAEWEDRLGY